MFIFLKCDQKISEGSFSASLKLELSAHATHCDYHGLKENNGCRFETFPYYAGIDLIIVCYAKKLRSRYPPEPSKEFDLFFYQHCRTFHWYHLQLVDLVVGER